MVVGWLFGWGNHAARASVDQPNSLQEALAIIVNTTNPVDDLSQSELRHIFLGERSHWPNARRITLVMMEPGQLERKALVSEVCQMNRLISSRSWRTRSKEGTPPLKSISTASLILPSRMEARTSSRTFK